VTGVATDGEWRALVAFTTADRARWVRRCLPHLARACGTDPRLDLMVALDGDDGATREFCTEWAVSLLYSDTREGVGLSKNRVLESFPGYDYYFFLEDDVEVLDGAVFRRHVELMQASGVQHMSLFDPAGARELVGETVAAGQRIVHYRYGHADLNAFTRQGLERVGGWHPAFAQYRRWGHTEHSYRFPRNDLAPAGFNVAVDLADMCIWHSPPSVTPWVGLAKVDGDGIAEPERELMAQELAHVPLQTLAPYHVGQRTPGAAPALAASVGSVRRYPFLHGGDLREAYADYFVWSFERGRNPLLRAGALLSALIVYPRDIALRHAVKSRLVALAGRVIR
jgi:hypothetical protein